MKEFRGTPGPWRQNVNEDSAVYGSDAWPVCEMGIGIHDRVEKDARLIAAAPELLEALQGILDNWYVLGDEDHAKAVAAISKALGE